MFSCAVLRSIISSSMVLLPLRFVAQEAVHGDGLRLSRAVHPPGLRLSNGLLLLCRGGDGFARHEWGEEDYITVNEEDSSNASLYCNLPTV